MMAKVQAHEWRELKQIAREMQSILVNIDTGETQALIEKMKDLDLSKA